MTGEWWNREGKIEATITYTTEDGEFHVDKIWLPIQTHHALVGWTQDFWGAFLERPRILRWIARVAMGRYAHRELYGTKESLIQCGWGIWDYSLQDMDYHKDKIPT